MLQNQSMRSPQKTDYKFNEVNFALYLGCYVAIVKPFLDEYKMNFTDIRILGAISASKALFGWRAVNHGITLTQLHRMTGIHGSRIKYLLPALIEKRLVREEITVEGKRRIYRYELTHTGKVIVNKITDTEKVNERIVEHLYSSRLLK